MKLFIPLILIIFIFQGCENLAKKPDDSDLTAKQKIIKQKMEEDDLKIGSTSTLLDNPNQWLDPFGFGGSDSDYEISSIGFKVALDKLSFMPLQSVDNNSGVIVTDWYSFNEENQRIKINLRVIDQELKDESIKVVLFIQEYDGNKWVDKGIDETRAQKIKKSILEESRKLQIASEL
tara:strand:- start:38 stop:568 length:531 start_codon:yes stop_codon:yes gene_type:complete